MIYTIILDNKISNEYTKTIVGNIQDFPYEIIDSTLLNTSFTESFNIAMIKGYKTGYDHIMICNNDISLNFNHIIELQDLILNCSGIFSASFNSPHKKVMEPDGREIIRKVPWVEFVAPIISRSVIKEVGLLDFDMNYGWGIELDYCYRALKAGYDTNLIQSVEIEHYGHKSQSDHGEYSYYANIEMNHVLLNKYGHGWQEVLSYPQW